MSAYEWIDERLATLGTRRLRAWSPPSDADLARLAAALGGEPPDEYRYFLTRFGGVLLGQEDFGVKAPVREPCPWGSLVTPEIFYPLIPADPYSIEAQHQTYVGRIPLGVLPFADDPGGNQFCIDVAGAFPGSVWFWDHEQRWFRDHFSGSLEDASQELAAAGIDSRRFSVHDIVRAWARLHEGGFDRPADYMGMYRMAPTFADFLRSLQKVPF